MFTNALLLVIMTRTKHRSITRRQSVNKRGRGFVNTLINKLPVELHLPGYNYCGPGTKLSKRLQRGDQGVNPLDEACKVHDIAYSNFTDVERRNIADRELAESASQRLKASDSSIGEKLAALGVTGAMKLKSKFGMGLTCRKKRNLKKRGGRVNLKLTPRRKFPKQRKQRIIPTPKKGGILPLLLPILGALGALGGGAAGIAKAVNDAKANRKILSEQQRHNRAMETVAQGKGLFTKPRKGQGLFMTPYSKNLR